MGGKTQRRPDPTPEEIREGCRRIREEGFWGQNGWNPPWTEETYWQRAGAVAFDLTAPVVSARVLGLDNCG